MLNIENKGRPLAKINGGPLDGKIVSVNIDNKENAEIKKPFNNLCIGDEATFQQIPDPKKNREVIYAAGPSGSGKSYYCKNYILELKKKKKKLDVYLISPFSEDKSLDEIKPQRIKLDKSIVTDPIDAKDLSKSCVLFDDIDSIKDREVRKAIRDLLDQCLQIGRHYDITVFFTNHLLCDNNNTKRILNEAHEMVFFPHSGSISTLRRLCECYGGIDNNELKQVRKTKSRWCCIYKNYPIIILTEHAIWHPTDDE